MEHDKTLICTHCDQVHQYEHQADKLVFLIPQTMDGIDLSGCSAVLIYTLPDADHTDGTIPLTQEDGAVHSYLRFSTPIISALTTDIGDLQISLSIVDQSGTTAMRSSYAVLQIDSAVMSLDAGSEGDAFVSSERAIQTRNTEIILLGKQGENLATKVIFADPILWSMKYGAGTTQLLNIRPGETSPYPIVLNDELDGSYSWSVTSADTELYGNGLCELRYLSGDTIVKSKTWKTTVEKSISVSEIDPPDVQKGWVDKVLEAGADIQEAAKRAEDAALRQPYPSEETGTWWVWDAEAEAYKNTGISCGGSGGGTTDHAKLTNRDAADQHPMSAIKGLQDALDEKQPAGEYITEETDPTVPDWAKKSTKPTYTASEVGARPDTWIPSKSDIGLGNVDNVQQYSADNPPPYPVTSVNGQTGDVRLTIPDAVELDITLKEAGKAADAKAVGDAISSLSEEITVLEKKALFTTDKSLTLKDGVLSVNTTDNAEEDNTLPISSAGVHTQIGNIEVLLKTI